MARATFLFDFEELPLVIEGGFEAGLVNGSAEIAYYPDGDWFIDSISLDGHKRNTAPSPIFLRQPVSLDEGSSLFLSIHHRLENEWRDAVNEAVLEQIAGDREYDADQAPTSVEHAAWIADRAHDIRKHEVA